MGQQAWIVSSAEMRLPEVGASRVNVEVLDKDTRGPISAFVVLVGPISTTDVSDVSGKLSFVGVPFGTYRIRVSKAGYTSAVSDAFEVREGLSIPILVSLARKAKFRTISTVEVRDSLSASQLVLTPRDVPRVLSDNIAGELSQLPGVAYSQGPDGQVVEVGLEGHPASETAVTLDGIPLNAPGVVANLRYVDPDLLTGASVSFGGTSSGGAGSIDFRTIDPTVEWQGRATTAYGSLGKWAGSIAEQGTTGAFGIALQHVYRYAPMPGNGLTFEDASGTNYRHGNSDDFEGDVLKIRYRAGPNVLTTSFISSVSRADPMCVQFTNPVPCSYGQGAAASTSFILTSVSDQLSLGGSTIGADVYAIRRSSAFGLGPLQLPSVQPAIKAIDSGSLSGVRVSAQLGAHNNSMVLEAASFNATDAGSDIGNSQYALAQYGPSFSTTSQTYAIKDRLSTAKSTVFSANGSVLAVRNVGSAPSASLGLDLHGRDRRLSVILEHSASVTSPEITGSASAPGSLNYNCSTHIATGYLQGDQGQTFTSSNGLRASFQRSMEGGQVAVDAFVASEQNANIFALINSSAYPSLIPDGYLPAVGSQFAALNCPLEEPVEARNVYFQSPISGAAIRYRGIRALAKFSVSEHLSLEASFALTSAVLVSGDPRLLNALSLTVPNSQVSGVPIMQAAVRGTYRDLPSGIEGLANLRFVGNWNPQNLSPHALVDVGVSRTIGPTKIILAVNNVLNTDAGVFQTSAYAQALVTTNGTRISGIAVPEHPRQITATFSVPIGRSTYASAPSLEDSVGVSDDDLGPSGYWFSKWPDHSPARPFEINSRGACTSDLLAVASPALAALAKFSSQSPTGSPSEALRVAVGNVQPNDTFTVLYTATAKAYTLTLKTKKLSLGRALSSCAHIYIGTADQATSEGLVAPTQLYLTEQRFYYSPLVGIYVIPITPKPGFTQRFRTYAPPKTSPSAPFAIEPGEQCDDELRPDARRLLDELASYFAGPRKDAPTPSWTIVPHQYKGKISYELRSDETAMLTGLFSCAHISSITPTELKSRGLNGVPLPYLNYSPDLGIYVVSGT